MTQLQDMHTKQKSVIYRTKCGLIEFGAHVSTTDRILLDYSSPLRLCKQTDITSLLSARGGGGHHRTCSKFLYSQAKPQHHLKEYLVHSNMT